MARTSKVLRELLDKAVANGHGDKIVDVLIAIASGDWSDEHSEYGPEDKNFEGVPKAIGPTARACRLLGITYEQAVELRAPTKDELKRKGLEAEARNGERLRQG